MIEYLKKALVLRPYAIIKIYEFLRKIGVFGLWFNFKLDSNTHFRLFGNKSQMISNNYKLNNKNLANHTFPNGFIEEQSMLNDLVYGTVPLSYSGCEIIALYNALYYINDIIPLPDLIRHFEKDGAALGGEIGTSPIALVNFLLKRHYPILYSFSQADFQEIADYASVLILTAYNDDQDITKMIHTICITKKNNLFAGHNCINSKEYENINELTKGIGGGYHGKGIFLIGIMNTKNP